MITTTFLQNKLSIILSDNMVGMIQNKDGSIRYFKLTAADHNNYKIVKIPINCLTRDEIIDNFDL